MLPEIISFGLTWQEPDEARILRRNPVRNDFLTQAVRARAGQRSFCLESVAAAVPLVAPASFQPR